VVDPKTMPVARIVNSALDGVADRLSDVVAEIVKYAGSDLLCYRADQPEGLVARQSAAWDPVLAWVEERFGVRMRLAGGVMPIDQDARTRAAIGGGLEGLSPLAAAALHTITGLTGSALLALAVHEGRLSIDEAWNAAHVDEDWNIAQWGEDEEAKLRRADRYADMRAAAAILELIEK
jgi:chaperone required for assembly of F1-ATPase